MEGDADPVEAYLASGGDPARQLCQDECTLLSRPSAFQPGHTLVHLAIRFQVHLLISFKPITNKYT